MRSQKGMTLIGWIGVVAILGTLVLATMRLLPVYLQYFKIADVISDIPAQMESENRATPRAIKDYIVKRFDIESINIIQPEDVKIVLGSDEYVVTADYDHKVPFVANVFFLVEFEKVVKVKR